MSEERQYFTEQARERLGLLGIAPGPKQPLEEKDAEIERLRNLLFHLANYTRVNVLPTCDDPVLRAMVEESIRSAKGESK